MGDFVYFRGHIDEILYFHLYQSIAYYMNTKSQKYQQLVILAI